jgi:hypothetical protein
MIAYICLGEHLKDVVVFISAWVHVKLVTLCVSLFIYLFIYLFQKQHHPYKCNTW